MRICFSAFVAVTCGLLFASLSSLSQAALLPGSFDSGHTSGISAVPGGMDGTVQFAVFDKTDGIAGDSYALGIAGIDTTLSAAGFDTTAAFLYLYQTVNNGSPSPQATITSIALLPGSVPSITGFGALPGLVFFDASGLVGAGNNLGVDSLPFAPAGTVAPVDPGLETISLGSDPTAKTPTVLTPTPTSLVVIHLPPTGDLSEPFLFGGETSSVFGISSDARPVLATATVNDSGTSFEGTVAVPVPTPTGVAALASHSPLLLAYTWRRRQRNSQ